MKKGMIAAALLAGVATLPLVAQAQIVANDAATSPEASSQDDAQAGIEDIVVTAQRRSENLQRAALAVSVIGADDLVQAGVRQAQDISKLVPALKIANAGAGTSITVRGVGNFAANSFTEPAVAINLDGVYLARSTTPNALFYDLERVEVLKGPQGTLYGRNATAGAVNIITRKPSDEFSADGTAEIGNYDLWRGVLAVNVPVSEGAALRVAGTITRRDGYFDDGYGDDRTEAARAQLQLTPTDRLSILLAGDYGHQGGRGIAGIVAPYLVASDPYRGATLDGTNALLQGASLALSGGSNPDLVPQIGRDGFVDNGNWGISAAVDYDMGGAKLTVLPAFRNSTSRYRHYSGAFPVQSDESSDATSVEVRLASDRDESPFGWLVGGYFFDETLDFDLRATQINGAAYNRTIPEQKTRSYAGFGQLSYRVVDRLRLIAGARYTHERKTLNGLNGGAPPPVPAGFPGPAAAFYGAACAPFDAATSTCFAPLAGELEANKVTWKAGVEYDAGDRSLLYANVATGFKAGGFFASQAPNTYRPEVLTAYTAGSKNRFLDNTLQVNAEAFLWKYRDKQVSHLGPIRPGGFNLITENAGRAEIYGAEIELVWQPTPRDALNANVQYLRSEYKDFAYTQTTAAGPPQTACPVTPIAGQQAVTVDCSGRSLPLTPRWTLNLSYQHSFLLGGGASLDAQVGTRIESAYFTGEEFLSGQLQKAVTVSNASITWRSGERGLSVAAFIDNIENEAVQAQSVAQPVLGVAVASLRPPRTFGLRLGFAFR